MENRICYVTIGQIQDVLDAHYRHFGTCMSAMDAIEQLLAMNQYQERSENYRLIPDLSHLDFDNFTEEIKKLQVETSVSAIEYMKKDISGFSSNRIDVFLQNSFHHELSKEHSHANFEIIYVYRGEYRFFFMDEEKKLSEGDVVIISPNALHKVEECSDDSFMISLYLNLETLNTAFLSLLQTTNFLSNFFKEVLTNQSAPNYLFLSTGEKKHLKYQMQDMILEQRKYDEYSPICSLALLKVFLAGVMRCYTDFHQYSCCGTRMDFGPVLEYISHNYKTASLGDIAEHFNYSSSYLSSTIRKVTGKKYSAIVKEARLREAVGYLQHTDRPIAEVALLCGYNDVDHFTKMFRSEYGCSPKQFQIQCRKENALIQSN